MGKTIRLKDDLGPGVKEIDFKDLKALSALKRNPKMQPFTKKERI